MRFRAAAARRPLTVYFVLAFAFSWACWSVAALGYREGAGAVLLLVGGFGPLVAAIVMTRLTGNSVKRWFAGLWRWRVAPRWYLFAIGLPVILAVLVTAEFALAGEEPDWSLVDDRLALFAPSLLFVALLGGGNEEPGWRGFALGRLQDRQTPVRSTLALGGLWATWHLPLLFAYEDADHGLGGGGMLVLVALTLASIVGYAFAYTYLLNRTGSVLLCVLLHAGFNTALSSAGLRTEAALQRWDYVLTLGLTAATTWIAVAVLITRTGGRLGREDQSSRAPRPSECATPTPPLRKPALTGGPGGEPAIARTVPRIIRSAPPCRAADYGRRAALRTVASPA